MRPYRRLLGNFRSFNTKQNPKFCYEVVLLLICKIMPYVNKQYLLPKVWSQTQPHQNKQELQDTILEERDVISDFRAIKKDYEFAPKLRYM